MKQQFRSLFVATQSPGDVYYRMGCFLKHMEGELWPDKSLTHMPNWESILAHTSEIMYDVEKVVARSNIVVWQRLSTLRGLALWMGLKDKLSKKMVVEIDDDALHVEVSNPGAKLLQPDSEADKVIKRQLELSDAVVVSTEPLKKLYKKFNKNVHVIKNGVDLSLWGKKKAHKGVRIMWQGGQQHGEDLGILMPVIPKILNKFPEVEFHFFGMMPMFLANAERCFKYDPVILQDYPKKVMEIGPDIIIAPLVDNYMNRGRSNLRVIEAGATRTPVVASGNKALPYYEIVRDSDGGLLADNREEWIAALAHLIENKGVREKMGERLYQEVKGNYGIKEIAKDYEAFLREV